jgi:hypothetical protein
MDPPPNKNAGGGFLNNELFPPKNSAYHLKFNFHLAIVQRAVLA